MRPIHLLLGAAALLAACGDSTGGGGADLSTPHPDSASGPPADLAGTDGAGGCGGYPCGPYGTTQGAVIANLSLTGQRDDNGDGMIDGKDMVRTIQLSDYFQNAGIKALFIDGSAGWCVPCKGEQPELVALYKGYGGRGGMVAMLETVTQDGQKKPSDQTFVDLWAQSFSLPFDVAWDPTGALGPFFDPNTFPAQMVIATRTMTITFRQNGAKVSDVKNAIDAVLNAK